MTKPYIFTKNKTKNKVKPTTRGILFNEDSTNSVVFYEDSDESLRFRFMKHNEFLTIND